MKRIAAVSVIVFLHCATVMAQSGGGHWVALADVPAARQEISSAVLNGKIYVMAGYDENVRSTADVYVYNPATDTWKTLQPLPGPNNHNAAAVAAGKLYSFAGIGKAAFVYDEANDSWTKIASMNLGHSNTPAVGVIDDKIYVAGGESANNGMEVYDPANNTWTVLAPMKVPRNHCAGGVIDGKFYVAAGRGVSTSDTALEVYDPANNSWTTLASMPTPRSGVAGGVVNGEFYVFGGEGGGVHKEVEAYNPVTNSWRRVQDMQMPRHGIFASVIGNRIYVPAGALAENYFPTEFNDVFVVDIPGVFANISTRMHVGSGDNALIGGFIVTGNGKKRVLLRALGPSVPLPGTLANPRLELYDGSGHLVAVNDNWQDAPNKQQIIDSSIAPQNDLESAILATVTPGNYTAVVSGSGGTTGTGLVEVYDLEAGSESSLANISTRGFVQTGNDVLIGGLILNGAFPRKLIVRAIGPSLGRPDALADPRLELRNANGGLVAENNNWRTNQEADIIATTIPPSHDLESAVVQTLPPAAYTAIVQGANAGTGLALVEAYALD